MYHIHVFEEWYKKNPFLPKKNILLIVEIVFYFKNIMKDKWMNIGYDDDDLKPYIEPTPDNNDPLRIGNSSWSCFCMLFFYVFFLSTLFHNTLMRFMRYGHRCFLLLHVYVFLLCGYL